MKFLYYFWWAFICTPVLLVEQSFSNKFSNSVKANSTRQMGEISLSFQTESRLANLIRLIALSKGDFIDDLERKYKSLTFPDKHELLILLKHIINKRLKALDSGNIMAVAFYFYRLVKRAPGFRKFGWITRTQCDTAIKALLYGADFVDAVIEKDFENITRTSEFLIIKYRTIEDNTHFNPLVLALRLIEEALIASRFSKMDPSSKTKILQTILNHTSMTILGCCDSQLTADTVIKFFFNKRLSILLLEMVPIIREIEFTDRYLTSILYKISKQTDSWLLVLFLASFDLNEKDFKKLGFDMIHFPPGLQLILQTAFHSMNTICPCELVIEKSVFEIEEITWNPPEIILMSNFVDLLNPNDLSSLVSIFLLKKFQIPIEHCRIGNPSDESLDYWDLIAFSNILIERFCALSDLQHTVRVVTDKIKL